MGDRSEAFAGHLSPGCSPALLLVDPVSAYLSPESPLFLDSGARAIEHMKILAEAFRARELPVVWTGVRYQEGGADGGYFFKKVPALELFVGETEAGSFPDGLEPTGDEAIFIKQYPSAFFRTGLDQWLNERQVDTLYIGGFSTSGCVRASVLDALQYGFIPMTVADACADREEGIHRGNLHDMGAKYSEVVTTNEVAALLDANR